MATMKMNRSGLTNEIDRATTIMQYAVGKFLGFKVPSNIADAYMAAKTETDYRVARRNLENILVGFFKKSHAHFSNWLGGLKLDKELSWKRTAITQQINILRTIAAEPWIDLSMAGDLYHTVHQMITQLADEQRVWDVISPYLTQPISGFGLDADLLVKVRVLQKKIEALRSVADYRTAVTRMNEVIDQLASVHQLQKQRVEDRQRARTALRLEQSCAKTA